MSINNNNIHSEREFQVLSCGPCAVLLYKWGHMHKGTILQNKSLENIQNLVKWKLLKLLQTQKFEGNCVNYLTMNKALYYLLLSLKEECECGKNIFR